MERHNFDSIERIRNEEGGLMTHEITPENRLEQQIQLATDLFLELGGEKIDGEDKRDFRNRIMTLWTKDGDNSFSTLFRQIEDKETSKNEFKFHPRFQGDIFKITSADMLYYKEHKELPEE